MSRAFFLALLTAGLFVAPLSCREPVTATQPRAPSFARVATRSVTAPNGYAADTITVGETVQLTATLASPGHKVRTVTWTSRNVAVVTVTQSGLATGVGAGAAFVVAGNGASSDSARITVTDTTTPPPPPSCPAVTDWNARATSTMAKPGYLQSATEPDFGTKVTRISGDPGTAIPVTGGTWPDIAGPDYAKRQAWSSDGAFALLGVNGAVGGGWSLLLNGSTYQVVGKVGPAPSYTWSPATPDLIVGVSGDGSVVTLNARTNAWTQVVTVTGYSQGWLGKGEGNLSNDGRYVPVRAYRASDNHEVVYVADLATGTKSADLDVTGQGIDNLDWASMSASGQYVMLFGSIGGVWPREKIYDRATLALVSYWQDFGPGHSDLGLTALGADVLFGATTLASQPQFVARSFASGAVTALSPSITTNWHASTRNTARNGWGYGTVNTTGSVVGGEMLAVKLDGSQGVERYGHHRSNVVDYDSNPFAVPSPDGRKIMFRSNWGTTGRPVQAYVVTCP